MDLQNPGGAGGYAKICTGATGPSNPCTTDSQYHNSGTMTAACYNTFGINESFSKDNSSEIEKSSIKELYLLLQQYITREHIKRAP